jgi:hypothetical protein
MIAADVKRFGADYSNSPTAKIAPFVEAMGSGKRGFDQKPYRKEFWWEREWRHVKDFALPFEFVVLSPQADFARFDAILKGKGLTKSCVCVDPAWNPTKLDAAIPKKFAHQITAI